ncbi:MAG: sugar phosphate isomerase/epimerase [Acidobacteriia bacterium]|nr:sugar phosphate isomerase/epimerase [Terriglobia bacterium]
MKTTSLALRHLALHPGTLGWRVPARQLPSLAAQTGFSAITLGQLPDDPHQLDEIGNALAQHSVQLAAFTFPVEIRSSRDAFLASLPSFPLKASFARQAGCAIATIGIPASSTLPFPEQRQVFLDRFRRCLDALVPHDLQVALECISVLQLRQMHPFPFLWRFAEMLDFARIITPSAGLLVDAWHWHHAGSPDLELPRGSVLHVHLADAPDLPPEEIRDGERLLPGEGCIDHERFFQQLRRIDYRGDFAVEVFSSALNQDPVEDVAFRALTCSREMLSRYWAG